MHKKARRIAVFMLAIMLTLGIMATIPYTAWADTYTKTLYEGADPLEGRYNIHVSYVNPDNIYVELHGRDDWLFELSDTEFPFDASSSSVDFWIQPAQPLYTLDTYYVTVHVYTLWYPPLWPLLDPVKVTVESIDFEYTVVPRMFTVIFVDADGTELDTQSVRLGYNATAPQSPEAKEEGWHFAGWDKAFVLVKEDLVVTAVYQINRYEVRFYDWDDQIHDLKTVDHSSAATAPRDPDRKPGWHFIGWDADFSCVTENMMIKAIYDINEYVVEFVDWDGSMLAIQTVEYEAAAIAPPDPDTKPGWHFIEWDSDFLYITDDIIVGALYEINTYTVSFMDWDGSLIDRQIVEHGSAALAPVNPIRDRYMFIGWDRDYSEVISDMTITAQYELVVITTATVVSFNKNLQDKNNNGLKFTVIFTLNDGRSFTVNHTENVKGGQKGNKTFVYNTPYGSYSVYAAWHDNNMVTICEVREVIPAKP